MRKFILVLLLGISFFANASVKYKQAELDNFIEFANSSDVGYVDERINERQWKVKYFGYEKTDYSVLKVLLKRRALELCTTSFRVENYVESSSVVAHRQPVEKRYVQASVICG